MRYALPLLLTTTTPSNAVAWYRSKANVGGGTNNMRNKGCNNYKALPGWALG
jgi:hypothetical protein